MLAGPRLEMLSTAASKKLLRSLASACGGASNPRGRMALYRGCEAVEVADPGGGGRLCRRRSRRRLARLLERVAVLLPGGGISMRSGGGRMP